MVRLLSDEERSKLSREELSKYWKSLIVGSIAESMKEVKNYEDVLIEDQRMEADEILYNLVDYLGKEVGLKEEVSDILEDYKKIKGLNI